MAQRRARFRGVKRTSKRLEGDILERSKALWEDASILRPHCAGNCRKCAFDKTFKSIAKLDKFKSNPDALVKMAGRGSDDIFKAYAGTVSLYASGSVPYTATAKIAGEEILFVPRGAVGNDKLIGCQHYNDPKIRLMLYNAFAKKKGLNLYSFDDMLICSNFYNMPEDYIYDTFWETPYEFPNDELECQHSKESALVIKIKSANKKIRICKNCAKDVSTLQYLLSRIISVNLLGDFEVTVEHNYHAEGESGIETIPEDKIREYSVGKITDQGLLRMVLKEKIGNLRNGESATYVIGQTNYGSDTEKFVSALKGSDFEIDALRKYLTEYADSVVIQTDRASEALSSLWEDSYKEILECFTSPETAANIGNASKKNPQSVLSEAYRMEMSKDVVKSLPVFKHIGNVGRLADIYAKAAKVGGSVMLTEEFEKNPPRDYHSRALATGFSLCVLNDPNAIKCTKEEEDLARYLIPFIKQRVDSVGEVYRHNMSTLLYAT
ncbi:MAG: hypothetical protein J6Y18_04280, partial [Candidatus Methanomethylophilaceae archaeon]|nr:hypothetical protein [Candidatus Methanomethylophilaceae archaeon]